MSKAWSTKSLAKSVSKAANVARATLPALALVAFWLPVLEPLVRPGMMTRSDDGVFHLLRLFHVDTLIRQGVLWPRWAPGMVFGYGYPLFNFYPILSYYPMLILHRLGLSFLQSFNLALALSVLASGLAMYLWARQVIGQRGAFVAAVAYMLSPYQLYDVYWRGNVPESLTLPMIPVVMWAALRVSREQRWRYALIGALAYAAIFLMHVPTSLIFTLALLPYLLVLMWGAQNRRAIVFQLAGMVILAVGLATFFLLPAYFEKGQVQLTLMEGWADFHLHFLSWRELLGVGTSGDPQMTGSSPPSSLGWASVLLATMGVLATWWGRTRIGDAHKRHVVWAGLTLIAAVAMTLSMSEPIWSHTPLLSLVLPFVQYPMRFLIVGSLLASLLAGTGVAALEAAIEHAAWNAGGASPDVGQTVMLGSCVVMLAVGAYPWTRPRMYPMRDDLSQAFYVAVEKNIGFVGTTAFNEYLPRGLQEIPTTSPFVEPMLVGQPVVRWDAPGARILEARDTGLSADLVLESSTPVQVMYRAFYYPGWQAWLDGQPVTISAVPPLRLMAFSVPAGRHALAVRFGSTPPRTIGALVSLIAVIVVVAIGWADRRPRLPVTAVPGQPVRSTVWLGLAVLGVMLLALKNGVADRASVSLAWWPLQQAESKLVFNAPPVSHRVDARLGNVIALVGFDAPDDAEPGQALPIKLVWQALGEINQGYKVFVHLLGPDGQLAAQSDAVPANWTRPTSGWLPGEYVTDVHTLNLSPDLPPGVYRLSVGMYDNDLAGERLPIATGGDTVELGTIRVSKVTK
jgi:hypothetical protein